MRLSTLLAPLAAAALMAAPARAEVRWQLDCQQPKVETVTLKGVEGDGNYGYVTFTLANKTGREVPVSLGVWATTDVVGKSYRGTIDPAVKAALEKKAGKSLKTLADLRGEKLADGATVDVVVSLGKIDPNVDDLNVHILGLCDRVYRDRGETIIEDKALILEATRPGDEYKRQYDAVQTKKIYWKVLKAEKVSRSA